MIFGSLLLSLLFIDFTGLHGIDNRGVQRCRQGQVPRSYTPSTQALQLYLDYTVRFISYAIKVDDQVSAVQLINTTFALLRSANVQNPKLLNHYFSSKLFWRVRIIVTTTDSRELIKHKYNDIYKSYCCNDLTQLATSVAKREHKTLQNSYNRTQASRVLNPYFLQPLMDCQTLLHGHYLRLTLEYYHAYLKACDIDPDPT